MELRGLDFSIVYIVNIVNLRAWYTFNCFFVVTLMSIYITRIIYNHMHYIITNSQHKKIVGFITFIQNSSGDCGLPVCCQSRFGTCE